MTSTQDKGSSWATVTGGFWAGKMDMVAREMLPYQWKALNDEVEGAEPSHAVENFRIAAGESNGVYRGTVFQDSDVAKWLEAASYSLSHHPDPGLEAHVEEVIRLIAKAQRPDGYINSYFIVAAPGMRWADLAWGHEFYCAGHLFEAAVAHNAATGRTTLLDVARRYADCIDRAFGIGPGKTRGVCGHPEIELALFRLFRATGEARYRDLAVFFLDERGRDPAAFDGSEPLGPYGFTIPRTRWFGRDYFQNHEGLRSREDASGHAVRAMYLHSAMVDEYRATGDESLLSALHRLWDSVVSRRMYVTGGIGSQAHGERFTADFDLPSDTAYAETCACIGLALWAARMTTLEGDSRYADVFERALYNGVLSGASLDGKRYFYVNPLEVVPQVLACRQDHEHVKGERVQWLDCACCPPNIARLVASLPSYLYGASQDAIWVHHYAQGEFAAKIGAVNVAIRQETDYPWSGRIALVLDLEGEAGFEIRLRIPDWCPAFSCLVDGVEADHDSVESGYLVLARRWRSGSRIELDLAMEIRFLEADSRIVELAGKLAIQRGPLVYCAESCDNGASLHSLIVDPSAPTSAFFDPAIMGGSVVVTVGGFRVEAETAGTGEARVVGPYHPLSVAARLVPARIRAVPYHQWGNREPGGEMRLWLRKMG